MATPTDAELILKLYELRTEATLRRARSFAAAEFNPKTADELLKVQRGMGTEENTWWRQAVTYWEMAASLVLRGALDGDLFFDSAMENVLIYTKFHRLYKEATGAQFMPFTAELIGKYPAAEKRHLAIHKRLDAQAQDPIAKADAAFNKG